MIEKDSLMQWLERAPVFWDHYGVYILGIIGWVIIISSYPIGWRLPAYAEF